MNKSVSIPSVSGDGEAPDYGGSAGDGPTLLCRYSGTDSSDRSFGTSKTNQVVVNYRDSATCILQQPLQAVATIFESNDVIGGFVLRLQVLGGPSAESRVIENHVPVVRNIPNGIEIHCGNRACQNAIEAAIRNVFAKRPEPEFFDDD